MDISRLNLYQDSPYHYKIGLVVHKGNGSIEEDFLLKDAFNIKSKAEYYQNLLLEYGTRLKNAEQEKGKKGFTKELYTQITDLKFEVAACSRLTVISFYAFVEGFVNSVGHSYLLRNGQRLSTSEKELLNGYKKGRFLQLKSKIEKFQPLIRSDKKTEIIVSDQNQIPENFKLFFYYYEELRNSAMHYSPQKENIWLKPQEWVDIANKFSKISMEVSLQFWKACYPKSEGPEYLGKLNYDLHLKKASERMENIKKIEYDRKSWHTS